MADFSNSETMTREYTNVAMFEQREPITETTQEKPTLGNAIALPPTISDNAWQLADIMKRPVLVGVVPWSVAQGVAAGLTTFSYPNVLSSAYMQANVLSIMTYLRAGLRIDVLVNGTPFHQGRLIGAWYPSPRGTFSVPLSNDRMQLTTANHMKISAETSETASLIIPYNNVYSMWTRFRTMSIGTFSLQVLNPLFVGTGGASQVEVSIYISMIDPQLHVPISPVDAFLYGDSLCDAMDRVLPYSSNLHAQSDRGGISALIGAGKSAATAFAAIETGNVVGAISEGISAVESIVEGIPKILGGNFDFPNEAQFPVMMVRQTIPNPALGVGQDSSREMNLYPHTHHAVSGLVAGTDADDMDLLQLVQRPCLYTTLTWTAAMNSAANLLSQSVGPAWFANSTSNPGTSVASFSYSSSWLSFVANSFALWRGSIRFRLEFIGAEFLSGRLLVVFVPMQTALPTQPTLLSTVMQSPHYVWDIKETHELIVDCPFNVSTPWLNVAGANITPDTNSVANYETASGRLYIYVLNQLVGNPSISPNAQINVWVSGGPNIDFRKPKIERGTYLQARQHYPSVLHAESDNAGSSISQKKVKEAKAIVLQFGDSIVATPELPFLGERCSLKDMLRRSTRVLSLTVPVSASNSWGISLPVTPFLESLVNSTNPLYSSGGNDFCLAQSYLSYYNSAFRYWSGKIRYNIVVSSQSSSVAPAHVLVGHLYDKYMPFSNSVVGNYTGDGLPNAPDLAAQTNYPVDYFDTYVQPAISIVVPWAQANEVCSTDPYFSDFSGAPSRADRTFKDMLNGTLVLNFINPIQAYRVDIWMSAGDDFAFSQPVQVPTVIMPANGVSN